MPPSQIKYHTSISKVVFVHADFKKTISNGLCIIINIRSRNFNAHDKDNSVYVSKESVITWNIDFRIQMIY